jgi:thioredoxin
MKTIAELTDENFDQTMAAATGHVVDLYAPWGGPCKMLTPLLGSLAEHFARRIQFYKVNVEAALELAARFEVSGVPLLIFFANGEPCDRLIGFPSPQTLAAKIHALTECKLAEARS